MLIAKRICWIFIVLAGLGIFLLFADAGYNSDAFAEQMTQAQKGDVIAMPLDMGDSGSGFILIDVSLSRIMVYEVNQRRGSSERLKLVAVRNFSYDKLLEQFNNAEPTPATLQKRFFSPETEQNEFDSEFKEQEIKNLISPPRG